MIHFIKRIIPQSVARQMQEVEHHEPAHNEPLPEVTPHNTYALHGHDVAAMHRHWSKVAKQIYREIH